MRERMVDEKEECCPCCPDCGELIEDGDDN